MAGERQLRTVKADNDDAIAATTVSGTIYKFGRPDALGYRSIRRIIARREKGGSVIMEAAQDAQSKKGPQPAHRTFFKGKLIEDPMVNKALSIEIFGESRTLLSEPVAKIELE